MPSRLAGAPEDRTAWIGGLRLHFATWGPADLPPLVLLHGGAANAHWWDWLAPELAREYRVLALDFPGHGQSGWPRPARYRMRDFAATVLGFADWQGIRHLDIAGHSMGGKVAMLVAAWRPARVSRLMLLDATPAVSPEGLQELRRIGARPSRLYPSRPAAARTFRLIPPETTASRPRLRVLGIRSTRHRGHGRWSIGPDREFFGRVVPEVAWPALSEIRCPTLILRGERSSILSSRAAQAMRRAIRGSRLLEIPDTYHHLVLEQPRQVARAMLAFLAQETDEPSRHGRNSAGGTGSPTRE